MGHHLEKKPSYTAISSFKNWTWKNKMTKCLYHFSVFLFFVLSIFVKNSRQELDVNECFSNPCKNGGACVDLQNGFSCFCAEGYTGDRCQTEVDACSSLPCQNGGTCVSFENGFNCSCTDGFTGNSCQIVASNWWQYPFPQDTLQLLGSQRMLQANNLIDSYEETKTKRPLPCKDPFLGKMKGVNKKCKKSKNKARTLDGRCNDFNNPDAGSIYYRFGRNVKLSATKPDHCNMYNPNPRTISRKLLARKEFIPATIINILAASWIQFQNHDWFDSGANDKSRYHEVKVEEDDEEYNTTIEIWKTAPDSCDPVPGLTAEMCHELPPDLKMCKGAKSYQTHQNTVTHWWDASQIYGTDRKLNKKIRTGKNGKLVITPEGRLPLDSKTKIPITGMNNNWWVGLELMHIIFTKEHNYIAEEIKNLNPSWKDNKIYDTTRLIIAAVVAKIHTLEWTNAILQNQVVNLGLQSNWYGVTLKEFARGNAAVEAGLAAQFPDLADGLPGAVGLPKNLRGVPYSITQDFIDVYRLHPLIPDNFTIRDHVTDQKMNEYDMDEAYFDKTDNVFQENSVENLLFSFGTDYPGAMTLHNYPDVLRSLKLPEDNIHGEGKIDLAAIDIMRSRERGVPRYNEFRRQLHLTPITSFENLTRNADHVEELREIYKDDVELLDLLVGSLAEDPLPEGFGFSDTFFRLFVLMARRRLESDRFYTDDYTPEVYTQWGLDYIDRTYMKEILLRHYPTLESDLGLHANVTNVFIPWQSQTVRNPDFPFPTYD